MADMLLVVLQVMAAFAMILLVMTLVTGKEKHFARAVVVLLLAMLIGIAAEIINKLESLL